RRVDVKIPLLPNTTEEDSLQLIRTLSAKRGLPIDETVFRSLQGNLPKLLTPGAAETLVTKVYRLARTTRMHPVEALKSCLRDYQHPISFSVLEAQIKLAVSESTDLDFIPPAFRRSEPPQQPS